MSKLLRLFRSRWFVTLVALCALFFAIWYIGPQFAFYDHKPLESEKNRLIAIGLIIAIWLSIKAIRFIREKSKNIQLITGIIKSPQPVASPDEQATEHELSTLKNNLTQAVESLKKYKTKNGDKQPLYQLPWYILIGPPGSGKTTLLQNSGLRFPLADDFGKNALRGVGGTRHCDWWFSEDAVLLDTAGRYTTQDSNQAVDSSAWLGFLQLLKKYRRRSPINGAIVAVSIAELLEMDEASQQKYALNIRGRIQELYEQLGIQIPIYLIFTKCDRIAGFSAYFSNLNAEDRSQVWGMTFPFSENISQDTEIQHQIDQEFSLLERRLGAQAIEKLEREHNRENRALIYTFPQQFSTLKQTVLNFTQAIADSTRYESRPFLLRGVYFTSATQEGSSIDRVMGSLAHHFDLNPQQITGVSGSGKGFFINHLLKRVIFSESGLASTNLKLEKNLSWLRHSALAVTAIIVLSASMAWFVSYTNNVDYINTVSIQAKKIEDSIQSTPVTRENFIATLSMLDKARNLPGGYNDIVTTPPVTLTLGLYQGDKLGSAAIRVYKNLLETALLPLLIESIEEQLKNNRNDTVYLYKTLKTYLMLYNQGSFDSTQIHQWFTTNWQNNASFNVSKEQSIKLNDHLQALLDSQPPWTSNSKEFNQKLVSKTRRTLTAMPLPEWVYSRIKQSLHHVNIPEFYFDEAIGRNNVHLFSRRSGNPLNQGIPGLFTKHGYQEYFLVESKQVAEHLAKESWVFGKQFQIKPSGHELSKLQDDILTLYLNEYFRHWNNYLNDIQIASIVNIDDATQALDKLSKTDSPLRLLIDAITPEINLDPDSKENVEKGFMGKAADSVKAFALNSPLRKGVQTAQTLTSEDDVSLAKKIVSTKFGPLIIYQEKNKIDDLTDDINDIYNKLIPLAQSGNDAIYEQQRQLTKAIKEIKSGARRLPAPINNIITSFSNSMLNVIGTSVCEHINTTWKNEIVPLYNKTIKGRYPINRNSQQEITQEDFGLFFGPEGKIQEFFDTYLSNSVNTKGENWHWISRDNAPPCVTRRNLAQFKKSKIIRKTLFKKTGLSPVIGFSLKPNSMSHEIDRIKLNIDGQIVSYAHEKPRATPLTWPGPRNSGHLSLQITPSPEKASSGITHEGPWAIFRLFDQAKLKQLERSNRFLVTFSIQKREATFELLAKTTSNPFNLTELSSFSCPQNLF